MIDIKDEFLLEKAQSLGELKAFCDKCDEDKRLKWAEEYGRCEGIKEGRELERKMLMQIMFDRGISLDEIASIFCLSVDELKICLHIE